MIVSQIDYIIFIPDRDDSQNSKNKELIRIHEVIVAKQYIDLPNETIFLRSTEEPVFE